MATAGAILLTLFYSGALFAPFLAPHSENAEFREHFFHPPSAIHFRDTSGRFVRPYVMPTYLVDSRKHIFREGTPIRIGQVLMEKNKNPYIAESIETDRPFASIRNDSGDILSTVLTAEETSENSGLFLGQTTLDPSRTGKRFTIECNGRVSEFELRGDEYIETTTDSGILVLDPSGEKVHGFKHSTEKYDLRFFQPGSSYKLFGAFTTNIHFVGVEPPGRLFLMGTDQTGRDVFSRILYGSRISLTVGLIGVILSTLLGLWIGGIAGYYGGKTDAFLMRSVDVLLSIPALYLILCVRNVFPTEMAPQATYPLTIAVLSLTGWAAMARVIRAIVLSVREEEYVIAARALGAKSSRILIKHILPNTFGYVIVRATLLIPAYILAEVTLSYLGLGIQEPAASWGNMLSAAQELRVLEDFSWILSPGIFLFLTVLAFNFLGDGLRDLQMGRQPARNS